jgi:hypothetical protein
MGSNLSNPGSKVKEAEKRIPGTWKMPALLQQDVLFTLILFSPPLSRA